MGLPSSDTTRGPSYSSLAVGIAGAVVGVQSLEAENFPVLRQVETGSWLVASARGQGLGVAMRTGVLALAFDRLDAVAALSSARLDNAASLGVSRRGVTVTGLAACRPWFG